MTNRRLKVLLLGPVKCGKSTIATYLSDTVEVAVSDYRPTQGVRIIEFESYELNMPSFYSSAEDMRVEPDVELWDCSGDQRFELCWPAIRRFADAAILVANPDLNKGQDLLLWYNEFAMKIGLRHDQILVLLHHTSESTNDSSIADFRLPSEMLGVKCIPSNVDKDGEQLRHEFTKFLNNVSKEIENRG